MADDLIKGFLDSVDEPQDEHQEEHQNEEKNRKSRRKRGITDINNDFLTVGGNRPIVEFEDRTKSAEEKPEKKVEPETVKKHEGKSELAIIDRKVDKLITGQKDIYQTLNEIKNPEKPDYVDIENAIKAELRSLFGNVQKGLQDLTKTIEDAGLNEQKVIEVPAENIPVTESEEYKKLLKEKQDADEFADKARHSVQEMADKLVMRENEIETLKNENMQLAAENSKMREAIKKTILSKKAVNNPPIHGSIQNIQGTQQPEYIPAYPPQPMQTPQNNYQGYGGMWNKTDTSLAWGNASPPAPDLLAEEEPKKKKGLFGRKK